MRAVIYARYSAGKDQTTQSIEGQVRVCKAYIETNGWTLQKIYADEHISGKTDKRPEFQNMINDAEQSLFDVLVVYGTDRFSRNRVHAINYKQKLRDLGIKICYAAENIPDTPEGEFMETIMEGWAQYYSSELSRKVKRGMRESAMKCKANGSHRTFGYYTDENKDIQIHEEEAPAVRHIFEMIADGHTIISCVRWLNANGYKGTLGKEIKVNSVRHMLSNKRYIGYYKFDDVEIPDGVPAIISKDLFYDVQERLAQNKRFMPKNRVEFILSGKLFCGKCGEPMTGCSGYSRSGEKYSYYRCRSRDVKNIGKEEIEDLVAEYTSEFFRSPAERAQLLDMIYHYAHEKNAPERDSRVPKKRLSDLERQKTNLISIIAETGNRSLVAKLEEIEAEMKAIENQLSEANKVKALHNLPKEAVGVLIDRILNRVNQEDLDTCNKKIIDSLVKEVILYEEEIVIVFNIQATDPDTFKEVRGPVFADYDNWWSNRKSGRTTDLILGFPCIVKPRKKAGA